MKITMPSTDLLITSSVAVCRKRGMSRAEAYLLVADLATTAASQLHDAGVTSTPWLDEITRKALARGRAASRLAAGPGQ